MTTLVKVALAALDVEQARLKTLPYKKCTDRDSYADYYGGKTILQECRYSGRDPQLDEHSKRVSCLACHLEFKPDALDDGKLPLHAKLLMTREQVELTFDTVAGILGLDEWSNDVLLGRSAARDAERKSTAAGALAAGLPFLTAALIRKDATDGTQEAIKDLLTFTPEWQVHDDVPLDTPFFTEAMLYELLGKDQARSLLARARALAAASGYQGDVE